MLVRPTGRLFAINPAAAQLMHIKAASLPGSAVVDTVHPAELDEAAHDLGRLLTGAEDEQARERTLVRRDGSEVRVSIRALLVRDPRGKPAFALVATASCSCATRRTPTGFG